MKRILISTMGRSNGLYACDGQIFSGVGFELRDGHKILSYEIANGKMIGRYRPVVLNGDGFCEEIDLTNKLSTYELQYYDGATFTGVGYTFRDGFCEHEMLFKDGVECADAWWDQSGLMTEYTSDNGQFGESYSWYLNGVRKSINISTSAAFCGNLAFTEDGLLRYFLSQRGFLKNMELIARVAKFFPFTSENDLGNLTVSRDLMMSGDDIDERFLQFLIDSGVLRDTEKLQIKSANVNDAQLVMFKKLPRLRELCIFDKDPHKITLAQNVKRDASDFHVSFNGIRVAFN